MENGLLYTFSTIAQALGVRSLLAALVLYRLQALEAMMWSDSEDVVEIWAGAARTQIFIEHHAAARTVQTVFSREITPGREDVGQEESGCSA